MSDNNTYILAKVTKNSDWEILKEHHREDNVVFYFYGETIISEVDIFKLGNTPIDFYHDIGAMQSNYNRKYENPSVADDELMEIDEKIIKMKELYNRLNLKQYTGLDI